MRLALLSDIHGNLPALHAVAADLGRRGVDRVVDLGDCVSGPLLPLATARYLMEQDWLHLAGNHERQLLDAGSGPQSLSDRYARAQLSTVELAWLAGLPPTAWLDDAVFFCHGTPACDLDYLLETVDPGGIRPATAAEIDVRLDGIDAAVIACGHSHMPRIARTGKGQLLVNPGSVGLPGFDDHRPYFHMVATGAPDARYAIVEYRHGHWAAELIAVPYPYYTMADLARRNHCRDWEASLRTGYPVPTGGAEQ